MEELLTNDAPKTFSSTSKESNPFSIFSPEAPLIFAFVFLGTSFALLTTASLGCSLGYGLQIEEIQQQYKLYLNTY